MSPRDRRSDVPYLGGSPIPLAPLLNIPKSLARKAAYGSYKAFEFVKDYSQIGTSYLIPKKK